MNEKEIIQILDNIDILIANLTNDNLRLNEDVLLNQIAEQLNRIDLTKLNHESLLYNRVDVSKNAFLYISNGVSSGKKEFDDSQNYLKWLDGEKRLIKGEKFNVHEALEQQDLSMKTGHNPNKRITKILEVHRKKLLPKTLSWIDKFKTKLSSLFKLNKKEMQSNPKYKEPEKSQTKIQQECFKESLHKDVPYNQSPKTESTSEIVAISDLHGDMKKWQYVKNLMKKNPKMKLVILGDAMDRAPYGLQILMQIKELCEQGKAEYLPGNHDLFAYNYLAT